MLTSVSHKTDIPLLKAYTPTQGKWQKHGFCGMLCEAHTSPDYLG